ncbi:hypothetical protein SAMN04487943_10797 [Gracilibacillus orientalis]|uniref:Uncharacterized protein n=1 Tax=Gracilibacillus orientalis TaxID=334253 RepID=A0A1I4MUS8_9BACI|nr:hypothetical protein [Gracilibacillus orientalis]SFM06816.1 hypothetical protein SAMN04487943_10797 [Gracilibacillus orientalis]
MKKSKRDQNSFDINQMVTQYMKDYMERISNEEHKKNNSFVYLENETLQMLIMYLFMKDDSNSHNQPNLNLSELVDKLDSHIINNRQGYGEVIQLLKDRVQGSTQND